MLCGRGEVNRLNEGSYMSGMKWEVKGHIAKIWAEQSIVGRRDRSLLYTSGIGFGEVGQGIAYPPYPYRPCPYSFIPGAEWSGVRLRGSENHERGSTRVDGTAIARKLHGGRTQDPCGHSWGDGGLGTEQWW